MFTRPTTLAAAFINATVQANKREKVDHQRGTGNWIARRVAINCDKPNFALIQERDNCTRK